MPSFPTHLVISPRVRAGPAPLLFTLGLARQNRQNRRGFLPFVGHPAARKAAACANQAGDLPMCVCTYIPCALYTYM